MRFAWKMKLGCMMLAHSCLVTRYVPNESTVPDTAMLFVIVETNSIAVVDARNRPT
jgi:hypothetical protein